MTVIQRQRDTAMSDAVNAHASLILATRRITALEQRILELEAQQAGDAGNADKGDA